MHKIIQFFSLFLIFMIFCISSGIGQANTNKVVVVPLGRSAAASVNTVNSNGRIWMDRNLGALRPATKHADPDGYGALYQWGRGGDGHQFRLSPTLNGTSSIDAPGNVYFYTVSVSPFDWRSPRNDNLWQGESGINNPCPAGFRLPTIDEWLAERDSWSDPTANGAIASPLKLPSAGYRNRITGLIQLLGAQGSYWSSTVTGEDARVFSFNSLNSSVIDFDRAYGASVRCIKN